MSWATASGPIMGPDVLVGASVSGGLACWFLRLRSERGRVDWGAEAAVAAEMRRWVMEAAVDAVATAAAVSRVAWRSWCVAATTAACCLWVLKECCGGPCCC